MGKGQNQERSRERASAKERGGKQPTVDRGHKKLIWLYISFHATLFRCFVQVSLGSEGGGESEFYCSLVVFGHQDSL